MHTNRSKRRSAGLVSSVGTLASAPSHCRTAPAGLPSIPTRRLPMPGRLGLCRRRLPLRAVRRTSTPDRATFAAERPTCVATLRPSAPARPGMKSGRSGSIPGRAGTRVSRLVWIPGRIATRSRTLGIDPHAFGDDPQTPRLRRATVGHRSRAHGAVPCARRRRPRRWAVCPDARAPKPSAAPRFPEARARCPVGSRSRRAMREAWSGARACIPVAAGTIPARMGIDPARIGIVPLREGTHHEQPRPLPGGARSPACRPLVHPNRLLSITDHPRKESARLFDPSSSFTRSNRSSN